MNWRLSRRTIVGLALIAIGAVVTLAMGAPFASGFLCGALVMYLFCLYTVRGLR